MNKRLFTAFVALTITCAASFGADEKYTIVEKRQVGQKISSRSTVDDVNKISTGATTTTQSDGRDWKVDVTVTEVKNGSATKMKVDVAADAVNTSKEADQPEAKTPSKLAGKSANVARGEHGKITNDSQLQEDDIDSQNLAFFIYPDTVYMPDQPVGVGETWDNAAKIQAEEDADPQDKTISHCTLDWVKTVDGKKMALISFVTTELMSPGDKSETTGTCLVDIDAGLIVQYDSKAIFKSAPPATQPAVPATRPAEELVESVTKIHFEVLPEAPKN